MGKKNGYGDGCEKVQWVPKAWVSLDGDMKETGMGGIK